MTTLKDARALAAQHGITLSEKEEQYIQDKQTQERARLIATTSQSRPGLAARWNAAYPKILKSIVSVGETLLTFSQTVIVSLGVPVVLALLLIVEHQRVLHGILLFEQDHDLASFAAFALVLLNLVLEFQIHHIEHSQGYREEQGKRWSFRIWLQNAAYTVGYGETWTERYVSPAQRYKGLLRLVTFSILALALVGSMRAVIEGQNGAWYTALVSIVRDSSLILLLTWIGGLLFAAAAVLAAQGLSRYVAIRCVEIMFSMQHVQEEALDPFARDIDEVGGLALMTIVNSKLEAKAAKEAAKKPKAEAVVIEPRPFGHTAHEEAEPVFMPMIAPVNGHGGNGSGSTH